MTRADIRLASLGITPPGNLDKGRYNTGVANAYAVLGVKTTATQDEIRAAYKRQVRDAHPDRHQGSETAHEHFLKLQAAYDVLSDPQRRHAHDKNPDALLEETLWERRLHQLTRRRNRLRRLYE